MRDVGSALEAAVALVFGGFVFLLFAGAVGPIPSLNLSLWGVVFILVGGLSIVVIGAVGIGILVGEVASWT